MKKLNVTAENFSVIREALKEGKSVNVNEKIKLVSFVPNSETLNENTGKLTRTAFLYVGDDGRGYTSTQLKKLLDIEPETKGSRKNTTFENVFKQLCGLSNSAKLEELKTALEFFQKAVKEREKTEAAQKAAKIEELKRQLKELEGK